MDATSLYKPPLIDDVIKQAYHGFVDNPVPCIVNSIILIAICAVAAVTVVGIPLIPAFSGGFLHAMLRLVRGEKIETGDFLRIGFKKFGTLLAANLIMLLGIICGLVLGIIPGIYLMIRWFYVNIVIMDQHLTVSDAFACSSAMVKGIWWEVFALWLIMTIMVGIITATCIGWFIAPAVECLIIASFYHLGKWDIPSRP